MGRLDFGRAVRVMARGGPQVQRRNLQTQYLPAIRDKARTLDAGQVLAMVRGA